jgi:hypothetical protein
LRGIAKEAERYGNLVVVGQGSLQQGQDFADKQGRGLKALVDTARASYKVMSYQRGSNLRQITMATLKGIAAASRGHVQTNIQGDAQQHGGTLVVAAGGKAVYFHRSDYAGDHPPVEDTLAALKAAAALSA